MKIYGKIANHDEELFYGQITTNPKTGLIESVKKTKFAHDSDIVFTENNIIFPGMGDLHVHAREDQTQNQTHKEDYRTAANAALNGGITFMATMPNTPHPLTTDDDLSWHQKKIIELNHPVTILNYAGIGPKTHPLKNTVPYKVYTGPSVGDLFFKNAEELETALSKYKGKNISFHVEDFEILEENKNAPTHSDRRPPRCVTTALEYLLPIIEKYEIKAKLCHWSLGKKSFEMIAAHRKSMEKLNLGYNTTIEVSPEHLLFDRKMLEEQPELWPYIQMNPAIQSRQDRLDLIEALRTGFIDYLATDHAPHSLDEKFTQFAEFKNHYPKAKTNEEIYLAMLKNNHTLCIETCKKNGTSGATWLDTYALVVSKLLEDYQFTPQEVALVTAYNPGLFINQFLDKNLFGKGFGKIAPGYQATFTILNTKTHTTLRRSDLQTKCNWSPLENTTFPGKLEKVIIKGVDQTNKFS